jgi:Flp pilus assembly protein TadD
MWLALLLIAAGSPGYVGSKACARCHAAIAAKYSQTAMAQASGPAADLRLPAGEVHAAAANATYSISPADGSLQLRFQKRLADGAIIEGAKKLTYYLGSGAHGRGFIFDEQGQPFQSPVAYYGPGRGWDLAPGYQDETSIFINRKVEAACLNCHSSVDAKGTSLEGAISCERCHGPGENHVNAVQSGKALSIVNPSKLAPQQRDSICAQCHLTGETRVVKPGRSETSFRPGDVLGQHVVPFVWASPDRAEFKVVGHFEGLWQSKCKRLSGDSLSCLTCHDPHATVPEAAKVAYYRQKCLTCHQPSSCKLPAKARRLKNDSCIACHMPTRESTDGQHTAFTDHSIRRNANSAPTPGHSPELVAFWPADATERDEALAYADQSWQHPTPANIKKAHDKLLTAWSHAPGDPTVAAQLAYTWDLIGDHATAESLYRQALQGDPENLIALTNLGTHLAQKGQIAQADDLWRKALSIDPGLAEPGLNLARGEALQGQVSDALESIHRVLSLHPDSEAALKLRRDLTPP